MKNGFIGNTDSTSLTLSLKSVPKIGEREGDLIMYLEEESWPLMKLVDGKRVKNFYEKIKHAIGLVIEKQ